MHHNYLQIQGHHLAMMPLYEVESNALLAGLFVVLHSQREAMQYQAQAQEAEAEALESALH